MTEENFKKAEEIRNEISEREKFIPLLQKRVNRFDDYLNFMDGRKNPVEFCGKTYKKAELKFTLDNPTVFNPVDDFDMIEENKKEFISFLKKCQANYKSKLEASKAEISALTKQFEEI